MKKALLLFSVLLIVAYGYGQNFISVHENNNGQTINLSPDKVLEIKLPRLSSTGYIWCESPNAMDKSIQRSIENVGDDLFIADNFIDSKNGKHRVGQSGIQIIHYKGTSVGTTTLNLELRRPWEKNAIPIQTYSITVISSGKYTGNYLPQKKELPKHVTSTTKSVPSSWDWRPHCTPIKNQMYCGDCWAYASVATLECNIKIRDGVTKTISEEFVTDCYTEDCYGCDGGWCAHQAWIASYTGANPLGGGAVYETDCPTTCNSTGNTGTCNTSGYPPHETIDSYADVPGQDQNYIPPDDNMKQAIYDYGPIWVTIDAGSTAFSNYTGGIFTETGSELNHAVVLVGWCDSATIDGGGYWIMRNSWGSTWGINGYMYISYGSDLIGGLANYIVYKGGTPHDVPPVANFCSNTTSSCTGIIQFMDNSTNEPTSWLWNFGDGTTSTLQYPTHTYTTSGTYTVSLKATNSFGDNIMTKTSYVTINLPTSPTATGGSCVGPCSVTLTASSSDTLVWYTTATGGTPIATGTSYTTPVLSQTTTYYVENDIIHTVHAAGLINKTSTGGYYYGTNYNGNFGLIFDVLADLTIKSVKVYSNSTASRTIWLQNSNGMVIDSLVVNIPSGTQTVTLNFHVPAGTGYVLGTYGQNNLWRDNAGANYPYTVTDLISITGNTAAGATNYYYYFYNWQVQQDPCTSARVPVVATITSSDAPTANFTVSSSSVCQGQSITFTNTSTNATSYAWTFSGGSPTSSTQASPTVTFNTTGSCNVTLVAYNGSQQDTLTYTVTVNPNPSVTATASVNPVCEGDMVILTGNGASSYEWNNGVSDGIAFTPPSTNTYIVTGTSSNGCTDTSQITVTVLASVTLIASITNASSATASDGAIDITITNGVPPYIFSWNNSASTEDLNNIPIGTYTVTVTSGNGCSTVMSFTVQQANSIISDMEAGIHVALYPNPTDNNFTLSIQTEYMLKNISVELYNSTGQKVLSKCIIPTKKDISETLSLHHLAKGNYFVKVLLDNKQYNMNMIKK